MKCSGYNTNGELGLEDNNARGNSGGEMGDYLPFLNLGSGVQVIAASSGDFHTCIITSTLTLKCWGSNGLGF